MPHLCHARQTIQDQGR